MRKELIVVGIAVLLICIVFSGCFNDENNDEIKTIYYQELVDDYNETEYNFQSYNKGDVIYIKDKIVEVTYYKNKTFDISESEAESLKIKSGIYEGITSIYLNDEDIHPLSYFGNRTDDFLVGTTITIPVHVTEVEIEMAGLDDPILSESLIEWDVTYLIYEDKKEEEFDIPPAPNLDLPQDENITQTGGHWMNFTVSPASEHGRWSDLRIIVSGFTLDSITKTIGLPTAPSSGNIGWYTGENNQIEPGDKLYIYIEDGISQGDNIWIIHIPTETIILNETIS